MSASPSSRARRWALAIPIVVALGLTVAPARAQDEAAAPAGTQGEAAASDPAAERAAMARALFTEGVELARQEAYADAADRFRRAHGLRPAPAIAYNLAMALVHLGELVEATELLREVIRHEETPAGMAEASRVLLGEISGRVARLRLEVDGPEAELELALDDRALGREVIGVAVPIDPGAHRLVATRRGDALAEEAFEVEEGATHDLRLTIPPLPPDPASSEVTVGPAAEPAGDDLSWLLWTSIAVVVVGAAAAVTAVLLTQDPGEAEPIPGTTIPPVLEWD